MNNTHEFEISFVVPVLNGEKSLRECLHSISSQKADISFEIIVVDNGSIDSSIEIAKEFSCQIVLQPLRGRSFARNKGIEKARGKWLAFIDCDVVLDSQWLKRATSLIKDDFFDVIQGKIIPKSYRKNCFSAFRYQFIYNQTQGNFCSLDKTLFNGPSFNSAACLIRHSSLKDVGGFDTRLTTYEDIDLSWRLWKNASKFYALPSIKASVYWDKGGFFSYMIRSYEMGKGFSYFLKKWGYFDKISYIPEFRRYHYSTNIFQAIDFLIQLLFCLGVRLSRNNKLSSETQIKKSKSLKNISLASEQTIFEFNPFIRLIVISNKILLKNIRTAEIISIEIDSTKCVTQADVTYKISNNIETLLKKKFLLGLFPKDASTVR